MCRFSILFLLLPFMGAIFTCSRTESTGQTRPLESGWTFTRAGQSRWLPATVPGTVHTDLLANGEIPDPFYRFNEDSVQWIEKEDWVYRTTFDVDAGTLKRDRIELVFEGLDTYADVYLNDSLLIRADNMFLRWSAEVKPMLRPAGNELRVYFHSPVQVGMEKLRKLPYLLPAANEQAPEGERTNIFTRKAPFHFGWDWGPRLVTSGLWRPVALEAWDRLRLRDVFFEPASVGEERAEYRVQMEVECLAAGPVALAVELNDGKIRADWSGELAAGTQRLTIPLIIEQPRLWWPNGLGEPYLYDAVVRAEAGGRLRDEKRLHLGVRRLELVQEPDSIGRSFYFRVNGVPVFWKGANYIPSDILLTRQTDSTYERVMRDAVAANMNALRVWGGAIYENDAFYDWCDRYGLLVWQDFMFACALLPGDPAYLDNVRREAVYNVRRLRNHACLALWCGNNENLIGWNNWGWRDSYSAVHRHEVWQAYESIFYDILPAAVAENHPGMSYWPTSPSADGRTLPDRRSGDEHDWTVWFGEAPLDNYWHDVPRFVSEYGMQSFPEMETVRAFTGPGELAYRAPVMEHRQRSLMAWIAPGANGNEMIRRYLVRYYPTPATFEDFVYLSQLTQALAMKTAVEAHRSHAPRCMGSLYWQINDCWPTMSWSSVDYYGRWKAAHYALRRAFDRYLVAAHVEEGELRVYVASDDQVVRAATLELSLLDFEGRPLWEDRIAVTVRPNDAGVYHRLPVAGVIGTHDPAGIVLVARLKDREGVFAENKLYFALPRELLLSDPKLKADVRSHPDGVEVLLEAQTLAKDVYLHFPGEAGRFDDNFFDLLPGERRAVLFRVDHQAKIPIKKLQVRTLYDSR